MIKFQRLAILLSTAERTVQVAKSVILVILPLISLILALRADVVAKLVVFDISPLTSIILASRVVLVAMLVIPGIFISF